MFNVTGVRCGERIGIEKQRASNNKISNETVEARIKQNKIKKSLLFRYKSFKIYLFLKQCLSVYFLGIIKVQVHNLC